MAKKAIQKKGGAVSFVRKANELVEGKYKFDIWEMRIFTKMVTLIQADDKDFKEYKIYLKDIIKFFGLQRDGRNYQSLKESALKLMSRIVKVVVKDADGLQELNTPIIGAVKNPIHNEDDDDNVYIKISFHPDLKPFLLALKSKYVVYDARNILRLPSTYSIRIYELLKQYEKIGRRKISVQELKEMFGVTTEYKLYANFKQRIIEKAQKDLQEHTDISFTFDEIKEGRAVVELIFYIHSNQKNHDEVEDSQVKYKAKKSVPDNQQSLFDNVEMINNEVVVLSSAFRLIDAIYPELEKWGIDKEVLQLLIDTQPEDAIRDGLAYTKMAEKNNKIKGNIAGFFISAVKNRYTSKDFEIQQHKAKVAITAKEKKQQKEANLQQIHSLKEEYETLRNNIIRELTTSDEGVTARAIELVKKEKSIVAYAVTKGLNLSDLTIEEYRQDNVLRSAVIRAFQKLYPDEFLILDDYISKIKALEVELKG
jgi:plasmid replication initiation protein